MNGSIRSRGKGTWELTVDLGRDASGKRRRKFVNVKGTKSKAQQKLRELLSLDDKGIPIDTQKMTLSQWLAKWLSDYVAPKARQKSQERYEGLIRKQSRCGVRRRVWRKRVRDKIEKVGGGV